MVSTQDVVNSSFRVQLYSYLHCFIVWLVHCCCLFACQHTTLQPLKFGRLLPSEASAGSTEPQEDDDEGALQEGKDNRWVSARLQEQAKNAVPRPTRGNILEPGDGPLVVHEY